MGEMSEGKMEGYGKEFWENGGLKYEGMFVDNRYNCENGKMYDEKGELVYEGMFVDGNVCENFI